MLSDINWVAVVIAGIVAMGIGALWYSPILFGKRWLKAMRVSDSEASEMKKGAGRAYVWSFVGTLFMGLVLSQVVRYMDTAGWWGGAQTGFWMWLGFVLPVMMTTVLFEKRSKEIFWINTLHHLAVLMVMGAILASWTI